VVGKSKWGLVRGKERREERSRIDFKKESMEEVYKLRKRGKSHMV